MCGRFALTISPTALAKLFELDEVPSLEPRYNIAPSQAVAAILRGREEARRLLRMMQWGLVPFWAKDPGVGSRLINARAETAAQKPAFRDAFARKRCLIPASGFFEWQKRDQDKQPYFIRPREEECFALAGLWQRWEGKEGRVIESCSILTTGANDLMHPIHDRMPVILQPDQHALWLDITVNDPERLSSLLKPYPATAMTAYPVSKNVNRPAHDTPDCIAPLAGAEGFTASPDLFG